MSISHGLPLTSLTTPSVLCAGGTEAGTGPYGGSRASGGLIAACLILGLTLGGEAQADPTKDVRVVNEPNVNFLNNVDSTITNDATNPVPVTVQNGNNGVVAKELVEITAFYDRPAQTGSVSVYTVPTGKRLVITDVQVSGNESTQNGFSGCPRTIQRSANGMEAVMLFYISFSKYYVSGIEFKENETVFVKAQCTEDTFFELRGYLMDNN